MEVRFESVTKKHTDKHGCVTAVNNLSITIGSGKLTGLLGPSGCGKTTSLFMIAGIYQVSSGKILFDGRDVTSLTPEKRHVGMVFQNYALYPHLTVRQNIEFPLVNSKDTVKQIKQEIKTCNEKSEEKQTFKAYVKKRVLETARLVEIEDYLDRKPSTLSGGQQQRVAIARAIVKRPSILLLDEPLSNLDARLRVQTREEIRRIQQKTGITTVFVTHDQEEALSISDEIVILREGGLQQSGEPQEIYDNPGNRFVAEFLGDRPINILQGEVRSNTLYLTNIPIRENITLSDRQIAIGIRPENIWLTEGLADITATVLKVTRLGGHTSVEALLQDDQTLIFTNSDTCDLLPGKSIGLVFWKKTICVFDGEGEKCCQC